MKKLIIKDHLGNILLREDTFTEGQDFTWQSSKPVAFWLGSILLVDKEPEPQEPIIEITPELKELEEGLNSEGLTLLATEPELEPEPEPIIEEVKQYEHEATNNQNTGEQGASETSEHESLEGLSKKTARGEATKRDKKPRKPKTA